MSSVEEWCAVQGFESVSDLAYFFATYEEARQEAGEAVAQAWLSAQTEAFGSCKGLLLDLYARWSAKLCLMQCALANQHRDLQLSHLGPSPWCWLGRPQCPAQGSIRLRLHWLKSTRCIAGFWRTPCVLPVSSCVLPALSWWYLS